MAPAVTTARDVRPDTLTAALLRAAELPDERGIALLDRRGRSPSRRSYQDLIASWSAAGARLAEIGVAPAEPLPIMLQTSWDFLDAWFGAVFAGAWPVALPPGGLLGGQTRCRSKQ